MPFKKKVFLSTKYLTYILLVLLTAVTFINVLDNGFVYDDNTVIGENSRVFNLWNMKYLFSTKYFRIVGKGKEYAFGEASYRPTVTATYFFDALVFKGKTFGCHLTNLLLHVINVLLVYLFFLITLGFRRKAALLGGLLFAIHPIVTESVNAIGFREDLIVVCLCMAGMVLWSCFQGKVVPKNKKFFFDFLHGFFYLLALFAKESAVVYPLLFLMVLFYKSNSFKKELFLLCLFAAITLFYLIIRFFVMVNPNVENLVYPGGTFLSNLYTMLTVFWGYIKLLFAPITLLADYNIKAKRGFMQYDVLLSFAAVFSLFIISCYFFLRKRSLLAFGWVWFFVCLAPVSNLVKIVNVFAERYLYIAVIGFCVFCISFFDEILKINKRVFVVTMLLLFLLFSSRSIIRNHDWRDTLTLWNSTKKIEPDSHRALSNLATHYFQQGDYKKAIKIYLECLQTKQNAQNRYNLANCYMAIKDYNQAIIEFKKALQATPDCAEIYNNLALTYLKLGMLDKAEQTIRQSRAYCRPDSTYYENLGLIKDEQRDHKSAIRYFEKALSLNPNKPSVYNKLGVSYYQIHDEEKALEYWLKGIKLFPDNPNFYKNLAVYYHEKNNPEKERYYWEKAHKIDPEDLSVIKNIIALYHDKSNQSKVIYYLNKLKELEKRQK